MHVQMVRTDKFDGGLLEEFGMTVSEDLTKVAARVLPAPVV